MHAKIAMALLLFAVACATSPNAVSPDAPPAKAQVRLVSITPASGSVVSADTQFTAEVEYSIENFKPGVDYYIAPQFASTRPGVTFNALDRFSDSTHVTAAEGKLTLHFDIARELKSQSPNQVLARPVRMWIYLVERIDSKRTRVAGQSEELQFTTAAGD